MRLNDTAALRSIGPSNVEKTVSTEKISNGYITTESTYNNKTGSYRSTKEFSENPPSMSDSPKDSAGSRGLSETMSYLKDC